MPLVGYRMPMSPFPPTPFAESEQESLAMEDPPMRDHPTGIATPSCSSLKEEFSSSVEIIASKHNPNATFTMN